VRIGRPQRFDQARPFVVLAIVVGLWIGAPLAVKSLARVSFFELTAPIGVSSSYLGDVQRFWTLKAHSNDELIEAGRDLARLNAAYSLQVQQNSELREQVKRLEEMLRMPQTESYRFEHARVVQRDFSGWWQRMTIRKGSNYGIAPGDPVVYSGGVVGRVVEVHAYTSVVQMVTDPGLRLAAVVDGDTRPMSYQGGDNRIFSAPRGTLEFVPLDIWASASQPKRLATSGLGGIYPPGLTIGQIVHVETSSDGLFKTGEVALDPRLSELTEVTVLVPIDPGQ
jgi:rod shape-determining protein MreC